MFEFAGNQWVFRGSTEIYPKNLNPDYETGIQFPFFFEKTQRVKFMVQDTLRSEGDNEIGSFETTVSAMMGAKDQTLQSDLFCGRKINRGKIIIRTEAVQASNKVYNLNFIWNGCGNI